MGEFAKRVVSPFVCGNSGVKLLLFTNHQQSSISPGANCVGIVLNHKEVTKDAAIWLEKLHICVHFLMIMATVIHSVMVK